MDLLMLVAMPCLFLIFFPQPVVAVMLSLVTLTGLCVLLLRQARFNPNPPSQLYTLGAAAVTITLALNAPHHLRAALLYFAAALLARVVIYFLARRQYFQPLESLSELNCQLRHAVEHIKASCRRTNNPQSYARLLAQLQAVEQDYDSRMHFLTERLDNFNAHQKSQLRNFEAQREDAQQSFFDLHEELERAQSPSEHALDNLIDDREIRRKFDEALSSAQRELDISSPLMSFKVVRALKPRLRELLEHNVTVKIRCELGSDSRHKITQKVAKMLRKDFKRYPNFHLCRDNSRANLFICDERFYVLSSFNVLSYSGSLERADGSCSDCDVRLRRLRAEFFDFDGA